MQYTVSIDGWGCELFTGTVSKKILEYVSEKYDDDFDEYKEACFAGDVPEELRFASDMTEVSDYSTDTGAWPSASVTVTDDDGNEVFTSECEKMKMETNDVCLDVAQEEDEVARWVDIANEKNYSFFSGTFECDNFNPELLKVTGTKYCCDDNTFVLLNDIEYDGESIEMEYVGGNPKGDDWYFFELQQKN